MLASIFQRILRDFDDIPMFGVKGDGGWEAVRCKPCGVV